LNIIFAVPALRANFYNLWLVGSYRRRNHSCQILSWLLNELGGYGCPKPEVSLWLWSSPLQQCYALPCYTVIFCRNKQRWMFLNVFFRILISNVSHHDTQKLHLSVLFVNVAGPCKSVSCNFEENDYICGYVSSELGTWRWTRKTGKDNNLLTGPESDAEGNSFG